MPAETSSPGSLTRLILPVGLFVVIVGAIAWVSQNLPKGAAKKVDSTPNFVDKPAKPAPLTFFSTKAVWDESDPEMAKEAETGVEGYYDFAFQNPGPDAVVLGFGQTSCDCSQLKVAVVGAEWASKFPEMHAKNPTAFPTDPTWTWTVLPQSEKEGVEIPAGGVGVARVQWNGRKGAGQRLRLNLKMWMHPVGAADDRSFTTLEVPIVMAEPLRFEVDRLALGVLGSGGEVRGILLAWSPTRDKLDLKVDAAKLPPNMDVNVTRLSDEAAKAIAERFRAAKTGTAVRSAFQIGVKLREQHAGKQLDQGPFNRPIPLISPDLPLGIHAPPVTATVRGDIDVGLPEDGGLVNLKTFSAKNGIKKTIPVWNDGNADLEIESVYPTIVEVKLKRNAKESTPARGRWALEVVVPPGAWNGPFQDDAVIILKTGTTPPRRIRIPIGGNAGQG